MRVAVVSKDNKNIDEHFGKTKTFLIYDLENNTNSFLEERVTVPLSEGISNHPFNLERFERVYKIIGDCQVVISVQVGKRPEKELMDRGIKSIVSSETIEKSLNDVAKLSFQ